MLLTLLIPIVRSQTAKANKIDVFTNRTARQQLFFLFYFLFPQLILQDLFLLLSQRDMQIKISKDKLKKFTIHHSGKVNNYELILKKRFAKSHLLLLLN